MLPLVFVCRPSAVEALSADGTWRPVACVARGSVTELAVRLEAYRPVFLRLDFDAR